MMHKVFRRGHALTQLAVCAMLAACGGGSDSSGTSGGRLQAIEFDYPTAEIETAIVQREAGVSRDIAGGLVKLGAKVRNLKNHGLEEGVSTRLLIYAGTLIREGVAIERACDAAIARPITDDPDMQRSIMELVKAIF